MKVGFTKDVELPESKHLPYQGKFPTMRTSQEFQEFLQTEADRHRISKAEWEVLVLAAEGYEIPSITQQLKEIDNKVTVEAVRQRLSEVYKKFQIEGKGPVKLAKLQQLLLSQYQQHQAQNPVSSPSNPISFKGDRKYPHQDLDGAPEVSLFYGRTEELATLKQWIVEDKCRLLLLLSTDGMGKTALSLQLARQIQDKFEYVVRRSLLSRPSIQEVLTHLIRFLSNETEIKLPSDVSSLVSLLIQYLDKHRCLILLDDLEAVVQMGLQGCHDRKEDEGYGELLRRVGESEHNSCLILNSREKPIEITSLAEKNLPIRVLKLKGLQLEEAKQFILSAKGFSGTEKEWEELIALYEGNPLALKTATTIIKDFFDGDFNKFFKRNQSVISGVVQDYLKRQTTIAASLPAKILDCLAVNPEPLTLQTLESNLLISEDFFPTTSSEFQLAIELLLDQSLIVQTNPQSEVGLFTIHPEVKNWTLGRIIAKYLNQIGYKKYMDGEFKSAKLDLILATRFNPDLAAAHFNLGSTYEKLENWSYARIHYRKAAEKLKNRASYAALSNLARMEILQGNAAMAVNLLLPSLEQIEDNTVKYALHKNLGWAYYLQQRYGEASEHLEKAIELDKDRAPAYCLLAQVQEAQNNEQANKQAIESWQHCLDKQPEAAAWRFPELDIWQLQARQRLNTEPS